MQQHLPLLTQLNKRFAIHVVRDAGCGCCEAWVEYLREQGFEVTAEKRKWFELAAYKTKMGIPQAAISCHTATIDGYVVEGHVPATDIKRLLSERPESIGLSVPGMPYGSPGMGPESGREAYDVMLIGKRCRYKNLHPIPGQVTETGHASLRSFGEHFLW